MKMRFLLFPLTVALLFLGGCGLGNDEQALATADPVAAMQAALQQTAVAESAEQGDLHARWLDELETAVARWESANITDYAIEILYIDSGRGVAQKHVVVVENGAVVENGRFCPEQTPNCTFHPLPDEQFTVPGLFNTAREAILNKGINENGTEFNFDPISGVPEWISLKSTGNAPWYWHVESFTPTGPN